MRKNAKHTHRVTMENARRGPWNGGSAPYGYAVLVKELRGNNDKSVLVIDTARTTRPGRFGRRSMAQERRDPIKLPKEEHVEAMLAASLPMLAVPLKLLRYTGDR